MKNTTENLLLIFTRNPELGKCKTRLAATVGDKTALTIYNFLLEHTVAITKDLSAHKQVYYTEEIWEDDVWESSIYDKKLQDGINLGDRMQNAFHAGFKAGFKRIIIIGSDMYDISQEDIEQAFIALQNHDFVVGPAEDGGYYLLGMTRLHEPLFQDKVWGTGTVLKNTLSDLKNEDYATLSIKNDVDVYEDIEHIDAFQPFLKAYKNDKKTT